MTSGNQTPHEQSLRVDRTVVSIAEDLSDEVTRLWWHREMPEARLRHDRRNHETVIDVP
jgi:hypothetical protein